MTRRWAPLVVASALTALLAIGAAVGADQVVERGAGASQPRLRTVPASTLARLGLTLSSTAQPPYCNLTDQAVAVFRKGNHRRRRSASFGVGNNGWLTAFHHCHDGVGGS